MRYLSTVIRRVVVVTLQLRALKLDILYKITFSNFLSFNSFSNLNNA